MMRYDTSDESDSDEMGFGLFGDSAPAMMIEQDKNKVCSIMRGNVEKVPERAFKLDSLVGKLFHSPLAPGILLWKVYCQPNSVDRSMIQV
jgi:hypothetical protein